MSYSGRGLIFALCFNLCLGLFGFSVVGTDILSQFATGNSTAGYTISGELNASVPTSVQTGSVGSTTTGFTFVDRLKMGFTFVLLILGTVFLPVFWSFTLGLPFYLQTFILIINILELFGLFLLITGSGS